MRSLRLNAPSWSGILPLPKRVFVINLHNFTVSSLNEVHLPLNGTHPPLNVLHCPSGMLNFSMHRSKRSSHKLKCSPHEAKWSLQRMKWSLLLPFFCLIKRRTLLQSSTENIFLIESKSYKDKTDVFSKGFHPLCNCSIHFRIHACAGPLFVSGCFFLLNHLNL